MLSNQSLDMLARVLGAENIKITVRPSATTASFDLSAREMHLPDWTNLSEDVQILLRAHEISHAINTPLSDFHSHVMKEGRMFRGIWNIVEDARIERLIQRKFPGLRSNFLRGYRDLFDNKIFGDITDKSIAKMNFADRFNMHFKLGFIFGVTFDSEEQILLDRGATIETHAETLVLARDIFAKMKSDLESEDEEKTRTKKAPNTGEASNNDPQDAEDSDSSCTDQSESSEPTVSDTDARLQSETESKYRENESALAKKSGNDESVRIVFDKSSADSIEKSVIDLSHKYNNDIVSGDTELSIRKNAMKFVSEFNKKCQAQRMSRTKIEKTGSLNLKKIFGHSFKDDLFLRRQVDPKIQNHGLVFFVDFSASMEDNIIPTLKRLYTLTAFCDIQKLPYDVYGFCDRYVTPKQSGDSFSAIVGLFKFSSSSFRASVNRKIRTRFMLPSNSFRPSSFFIGTGAISTSAFGFSGTPLNHAIFSALHLVPKFQKDKKLDVVHCVFLTDGGGGDYVNHKKYMEAVEIHDKIHNMYYSHSAGENKKSISHAAVTMLNRMGISMTNFFVSNVDVIRVSDVTSMAVWAGNTMAIPDSVRLDDSCAVFGSDLIFNETYMIGLKTNETLLADLFVKKISKKLVL